jgi:hypothetical protein
MKYMLLLFDENEEMDMSEAAMAPWIKFGEDAAKLATQTAGEALHPSSTATVVSVRDGKRIVTDGPFVTSKEQIGGFYIFDCDNLDTALKLAEMIPWASTGHVEVRPVVDFGQ